jgi:Na+/phosphate symporter
MTASFAAEGMVGLVPALAIMLGANVGTTLIVQILSFNVTAAAPVLFVVGLVAFRGELAAFHRRILDSLRLAFSIFMSGDVSQARRLIREKAGLRNAELVAAERHFERLREGRPESIETTSLHLDVLRDPKRIHSHICSVAYPVLEAAGEMPAAETAESDPIILAAPARTERCRAEPCKPSHESATC